MDGHICPMSHPMTNRKGKTKQMKELLYTKGEHNQIEKRATYLKLYQT